MPTYAYRCPGCSQEFERLEKMTDPAEAPCPRCGTVARRVISGGAGLLFKGSGFYITDHRSPSYKEAEKKEKEKEKGKGDGGSEEAPPAGPPASKTEAGEGKT